MNRLMRVWLLAALLLAFFTPQPTQANAGEYDFDVSLGTYDDISDETGYTVSTATDDDGAQNITLPFTFKYDNMDYTTGRISVNGWLEMGQTYTGGGYTNALDSTEAKPLLAPLWDDLLDDTSSEIGYVTLGNTPNQVFVVQWKNVLWPVTLERTPQNFQVRLYETTKVIEFVYGAMNAPGSQPSASIGINDATGGSGHFLSVTPAAGTADTVSSTTANNSITSAANLTNGKTYTFTPSDPTAPPSCAVNVSPADGATDVVLNAALNWRSGGGVVTGYRLYFGADNPPTNIVNGTDWGNVTTYDPAGNLAPNTTYYWQIVPYNTNGDATGCPVWSFTTGAAPLSAFPYVEGFEGGAGGWTSGGGNSSWALGTPAGAVIVGASTGDNAWATNLDGDYNNDEQSYVLSPFFDFSGLDFPYVKFDLWWDAETSSDGAQLQASADGGATWQVVGAQGEGFNWYNEAPDGLGVNADGWSGDIESDEGSGGYSAAYGWRTTMHDLYNLANEPSVRFRFFFGSDAGYTYDGFAFDNFEIRSGCAWTGAVGADWHTAGNWDCSHVPGAEEIVILPYDDSVAVPVISEDAAAAAVGVDYDLILDGGNLTARYVYEYGLVYIAEGYEVNLIGSGNAWEATWETAAYWNNGENGLVRFSGPGVQRIVHSYDGDYFTAEDYAQFYEVQVDEGVYLDVKSNLEVTHTLTLHANSTLDMSAFDLQIHGTLVNSGTLIRQQNVDGAPVTFFGGGGYGGLILDPGAQNLGATTVQIRGGQDCTTVPGETLQRCFNIAPTTAPGSPGVAVTFYFTAADIPAGHTCETVELYHHDGITWTAPLTRDVAYGTAGRICSGALYSIRVTGVTDFSPFVLSGSGAAPTAVSLQRLRAAPGLAAGSGLVLGALAVYGISRLRKATLRKRRTP